MTQRKLLWVLVVGLISLRATTCYYDSWLHNLLLHPRFPLQGMCRVVRVKAFILTHAASHWRDTTHAPHQFLCVPVKDIVVGVAEFVEEVPEELSQERVVWPVLKLERPTEVEVSRKLTYRHTHTHINKYVLFQQSAVTIVPFLFLHKSHNIYTHTHTSGSG